jgi:hypothetical protein
MKLAEALLLRAEYQTKISNLQGRILSNLKVQEDEKPNENPQELLKELLDTNDELCDLIKKINAKNNTATLPDGKTLSEAIVEREMLMKKRGVLSQITAHASNKDHRLTRTEIKMNLVISIEEIQKQIDGISKEFRELDVQIQSLNWTVDLE